MYEYVESAYVPEVHIGSDIRLDLHVRVADIAWDEAEHRRAVANLRGRARGVQIRVRARDREIRLIDPMNNVIHEGDVLTATAFLMGIDLDEVVT